MLCAKVISNIIKSTFTRNCSARGMFQTVVFLRNQYSELKGLQEQLALVSQIVDVRNTTLTPTFDRLTLMIASRRNDCNMELRIDLDSSSWWKQVKLIMAGHQEQVDMLQAACRLSPNYLSDLVLLLSKKLI